MTRTNVSKLSRLERSFVAEMQGPPAIQPRVPAAVVGSINHHDLDAHRYYQVCVFITAGPMIKLCAGGEGDSEGHVL